MATKKKTKKPAGKKTGKVAKAPKKKAAKKSAAKKSAVSKKRLVARPAQSAVKRSARPALRKPAKPPVRKRGKQEIIDTVAFEPKGLGPRSGGQSGDLQGLSNRAGADSESVDELLAEGNAFEAEVVKGIEDVPDADEGEIVTHEVPEDDVPGEYDDDRPGRK
jgi:hypothetical protein